MIARDPLMDPRQGDVVKSPEGKVKAVMGRLRVLPQDYAEPLVRYSQAENPYMTTVTLVRWQHLVGSYLVEAVGATPAVYQPKVGDVWRDDSTGVRIEVTALCPYGAVKLQLNWQHAYGRGSEQRYLPEKQLAKDVQRMTLIRIGSR